MPLWLGLHKKSLPQGRHLAHNIFIPTPKILLGGKQGSQPLLPAPAVSRGDRCAADCPPSAPQDYWLSLLYKRLIGPKVLAIHVAGLQRKPRPGRVIRDKLRIYAHCTSYHK